MKEETGRRQKDGYWIARWPLEACCFGGRLPVMPLLFSVQQ